MDTEKRQCQQCKGPFTIEPDDFSFYEKMGVPAPPWCPECRFRRRSVFRNEQTLYKRTCALCGASTLSMYHPRSPYTVYCVDCWLSDRWDPFDYGQTYDPNTPFFEQMGELLRRVPKAGIFYSSDTGPVINSEYINFAGGAKDCYFVFNSSPQNENCAYGRGLSKSRDVFDAYFCDSVERVYEAVNVHRSQGIAWGTNVVDSLDSAYLHNCAGCSRCFGCVNLRHKTYHFLNEPLVKAEYEKRVRGVMGSHTKTEEFKRQFKKFVLRFPHRAHQNLRSVNVTGDYIFDSKECADCFEIGHSENLRHSFAAKFAKDSYDITGHGRYSELLLEGVAVGTSTRVIGSWWTTSSHDIEYCFGIRSCADCVGCDSVRNAQFCVLNKRYDAAAYRQLRKHIVAELRTQNQYGSYFPPSLAPFAYNEAIGQDNLPLAKDEALNFGFRWEDDLPMTRDTETLVPEHIPNHIRDVTDAITKEILVCVDCGRNYRIIPMELQFYRTMILPIPRRCFFCRHADRLRQRGPMKIYDRTCAKCGAAIKTSYAPDRPEMIYCERCYNAEVA